MVTEGHHRQRQMQSRALHGMADTSRQNEASGHHDTGRARRERDQQGSEEKRKVGIHQGRRGKRNRERPAGGIPGGDTCRTLTEQEGTKGRPRKGPPRQRQEDQEPARKRSRPNNSPTREQQQNPGKQQGSMPMKRKRTRESGTQTGEKSSTKKRKIN